MYIETIRSENFNRILSPIFYSYKDKDNFIVFGYIGSIFAVLIKKREEELLL